jgi:hypothetical protein
VEGRTSTALLEHTEGSRLGFRIADALHKLHHSGVAPERPPHSLADEIRILREALDDAGEREPAWRDRLSRVQAACESLATTIDTSEPVTLHRDFYPDQVLIAGHTVCLLDLDLYCEGDASLDAGNFTAHVIEQSLRRFGHPEALASFSNAFRERFLQLSGEHRRPAVAAYETLSLARHIFISLRIRERQSAALSMLEFCESRLGLAEPPAH